MTKFRFLIALLLVLSVGGCKKKSGPDCPCKSSGGDGYLRVSFHTEVQSLNPRKGIDFPTFFAVKMLFEGLTYIGPDQKPHPAIAESYEISEDQKTYTFHLRPTIWTNGDRVTAHDFAYSWRRVIDPNDSSLGAENFYPIKNVEAAFLGQKPMDSVGIEVLDNSTLRVELEHPTPYFLDILATPAYLPVNRRVDQEDSNWENSPETFVCNGPFLLEKHHFNDEIVVAKNPQYWNEKEVKLPGIRVAIVKDMTTQLNLFEKNEIQWLGNPISKFPLDAIQHLKDTNQLEHYPTLSVYWYFINTESFPFQNKKMRQAFAYALNRKMMCDTVLEAGETPAHAILPHSLATQDCSFFDYNQEKALALFEEALEEMNITRNELPTITLNYAVVPAYTLVAEETQQEWQNTFGIEVKLEHQDWRGHFGKLQSGNFQIGGMGWQSWLRDPIYIMQTFRKKDAGINMCRWENQEFQSLLNEAEAEANLARRKELFNQAEALLMEEMPVIPVYYMTLKCAKNPKLKDVYISDLYEADFRWAYFDE